MFARGKFGNHSAVGLVSQNLRKHHVGEQLFAIADDCSRSLVTRALNPQNKGHVSILALWLRGPVPPKEKLAQKVNLIVAENVPQSPHD